MWVASLAGRAERRWAKPSDVSSEGTISGAGCNKKHKAKQRTRDRGSGCNAKLSLCFFRLNGRVEVPSTRRRRAFAPWEEQDDFAGVTRTLVRLTTKGHFLNCRSGFAQP